MAGGAERRKETFLIVEDDATTVRYARQLLKERFTVVSAGTVREACAAIAQMPRPAAVVIDGRLPDGRGLDVARRVHARYPDIAMLLMTGHPDEQDFLNFGQSIGAESAVKPGGSIPSFARRVVIRKHVKDDTLIRRTDAVAAAGELSLCRAEVLAVAVTGAGPQKIAAVIGVSLNTVKSHALAIGRAYRKALGDVAWGIQTGEGAQEPLVIASPQVAGRAH